MALPLSIYIHWPFCKSKCPYCDFNSHVREGVNHQRWRDALVSELIHYANLMKDRRVVSVFFGGGTPSLMEAETVRAVLHTITEQWGLSPEVEVTLEANPTSVEASKFKEFALAGVNRLSLGIQSLKPEALKFLGRQHSAEEARAAIALAQEYFPRMTFDLIYALPGQTLKEWEQELREAVALSRGHLSLYQLTIEENTAFAAAYRRGEITMIGEEEAAAMYELTDALMGAHGMPAYEISNYAAPGQQSRHNLTYWQGDDYIGIGPGAHGRYKTAIGGHAAPEAFPDKDGEIYRFIATENVKSPERWLDAVSSTGAGLQVSSIVEPHERTRELLMMGLRLTSGIAFDTWRQRTGLDMRSILNPQAIALLRKQRFIDADEKHIKATRQGALLLNSVIARLIQ